MTASRESVYNHWKDDPRIEKKCVCSPNICMACGQWWEYEEDDEGNFKHIGGFEIQKAHIKPKQMGGSDKKENLHNLCSICHRDSEGLSGWLYWEWLKRRTHYDTIFSFYNWVYPNAGGSTKYRGNRIHKWMMIEDAENAQTALLKEYGGGE